MRSIKTITRMSDVLDLPISVTWDCLLQDEALGDIVLVEDLMVDDLEARFDPDIQEVCPFTPD